jgi:hypothetical protein
MNGVFTQSGGARNLFSMLSLRRIENGHYPASV